MKWIWDFLNFLLNVVYQSLFVSCPIDKQLFYFKVFYLGRRCIMSQNNDRSRNQISIGLSLRFFLSENTLSKVDHILIILVFSVIAIYPLPQFHLIFSLILHFFHLQFSASWSLCEKLWHSFSTRDCIKGLWVWAKQTFETEAST